MNRVLDGFGDKTGGNFLTASVFHSFSRTLLQGFTSVVITAIIIIIIIIMGQDSVVGIATRYGL